MAEMNLSQREMDVLKAVVVHYIRTAQPVGSGTVSTAYRVPFSSATIRNTMVDLEDKGLMYQPHVSAGRAPTQKGMRYFLDHLIYVERLSQKMKKRLNEAMECIHRNIPELLQKTSRLLSSVSDQAGVVLLPRLSKTALERVRVIKVAKDRAMVILLTTSGMVHNMIVDVEEKLKEKDLERYCAYLNDTCRGLTLSEIRERIVDELKEHKDLFDRLYYRILALTGRIFSGVMEDEELFIEGRANLLKHPEFADLNTMKHIFAAFEERWQIVKLLDRSLGHEGVRVILGSESGEEGFEGVGLISSPYFRGDNLLGTLGIIGPVRMDYPRLMPVVDYTAKLVSRLLEDVVS